MYCKYCGIRLRGNKKVLCSVCESLKNGVGKDSEEFSYSREELADARRKKPSARRFVVFMTVAAAISYGASFIFDVVAAAAH